MPAAASPRRAAASSSPTAGGRRRRPARPPRPAVSWISLVTRDVVQERLSRFHAWPAGRRIRCGLASWTGAWNSHVTVSGSRGTRTSSSARAGSRTAMEDKIQSGRGRRSSPARRFWGAGSSNRSSHVCQALAAQKPADLFRTGGLLLVQFVVSGTHCAETTMILSSEFGWRCWCKSWCKLSGASRSTISGFNEGNQLMSAFMSIMYGL